MEVFYINSYDIVDEALFSTCPPQVLELLKKYDGKVLAADTEGIRLEGTPRKMNAIIHFPSEEAALKCYRDPAYQPMKAIRLRSTTNCTMVLVKVFPNP